MRNQLLSLLLLSLIATSVLAKHTASSKRGVAGLVQKSQTHDLRSDLFQKKSDLQQKFETTNEQLSQANYELTDVRNQLEAQTSQLAGLKDSLVNNADPSDNSEISEQIQQHEDRISILLEQQDTLLNQIQSLDMDYSNIQEQLLQTSDLLGQLEAPNNEENQDLDQHLEASNEEGLNAELLMQSGFEQKSEKKNEKVSLRRQEQQKVLSAHE